MERFIKNNLKTLIFVFLAVSLLLYTGLSKSFRRGDGWEYLLMSVSYHRHHSFDLQQGDIDYAYKNIALKNNLEAEFNLLYRGAFKSGYFKAFNQKFYSYHFWGYSLIASLFIPIFLFLKLNILNICQFTNAFFLVLLMYWVNFRVNLSDRQKLWLNIIILIGPTWYYLKWTHPEMVIFSLIFISLLEYKNNKKISACIFSALASLQNSTILIYPAFLIIKEIIEKRKINKEIILMGLSSSIALVPFVFYYINYNTFSLIGKYCTSCNVASISRAMGLFFDFNFGLFYFIPLIIIAAIILCIKKDKTSIMLVSLVVLLAYACTVQINWNSDMQYLNRYSFWFIPFLFMATLDFFVNLDKRWLKKMLIIYFCTTTIPCIVYASMAYNYLEFGPLAKIVLNLKPSLYNPEHEVFYERASHSEDYPKYPVIYRSKIFGTEKVLIKDQKTGLDEYLNKDKIGKIKIKDFKIKIRHKGKKCEITIGEINCSVD